LPLLLTSGGGVPDIGRIRYLGVLGWLQPDMGVILDLVWWIKDKGIGELDAVIKESLSVIVCKGFTYHLVVVQYLEASCSTPYTMAIGK
jgi:hypothetical protein